MQPRRSHCGTALRELVVLELSSPHSTFEHQVKLFVRPAFGLWYAEEAPYEAQGCQPTEEEAELTAQVGLIWIDHIWNRDGHRDAH